MLQLPLLGSAMPGLSKASGVGASGGTIRLETLLQGADGSLNVFSGELQALLMQLSPAMLQRLEDMMQSGMSLPQAASALLSEQATGQDGMAFPALLAGEEGGEPVDIPDVDGPPVPVAISTPPESAVLRGTGVVELVQMLAMTAGTGSVQLTGPTVVSQPLPQSLAANLLHMGVPQEVGSRGWDGAIADRVMWMVQGEQQTAKLRLNPPNLGPLEVRVTINQDQASVSFLAQHAAVREALEAALPRLREMFDQQSMQLVRADVSDPGSSHEGRAGDAGSGGAGNGRWSGHGEHELPDAGVPDVTRLSNSLIDLFA